METNMPRSSSASTNTKTVAIIGAGISGLLACKHALGKGFFPTVFEARNCVAGVWSSTLDSTKLQTPKDHYQFSDFVWPDSVVGDFPDHNQVMDYITSYALHFNIFAHIKFNTRVISIDYCTTLSGEEMSSWEAWGGTGEAFSPKGKWNIIVKDLLNSSSDDACDHHQAYQFDFVIMCIGKYSDLPNIPKFPVDKGPEVFQGTALHSMDYAAIDNAADFIKGKRVAIIGSQKSALDIAAEVTKVNGVKHPCTLVFKTAHWSVPEKLLVHISRNLNRFSEFMVHKPDEGFFLWLLAVLLSPMLWIFSIAMETYLKWIYPLSKYNMVPEHRFLTQIRSCMLTVLPANFYDRVGEGSLILKKSESFSFCENGLVLDNQECAPLETDIVIFATGFASEQKLANLFSSPDFQKCLTGSSAPLYRECIHPKVPQLGILGYIDSHATLYSTEMRAKWLACFLAGSFKLPTIRDMEDNVKRWENCSRRYTTGQDYKRECVSVLLQIHCNDELCRDMRCNPRRKKSVLSELFAPYSPLDYAGL